MTPSPIRQLLITGGRLFVPTGVVSAALLVEDGIITAIGDDADARASADAHRIDAAGCLVSPGFQDSHIHPFQAGIELLTCSLSELSTADEYLDAISAYAAANPDSEWITGGGWAMEAFEGGIPTAAQLDRAVPDRPAFFPNRDHHGAWVNTRALELAGITANTPDPADGRIERDSDGNPVGMLQEGAADLVSAILPVLTEDQLDAAIELAQERLFAWGVTAWQDAIVGAFSGVPDILPSYMRVAASGVLKAHVVGALWWDRGRGLGQIAELDERRAMSPVGTFAATTVKIMQDGVAENFTAGMLEPYLDGHGHSSANAGSSFVDPTALRDIAIALDALGFQLHFHALGDRAVREALDAIAAAEASNGRRDLRHHLAHLQVVHPDDVPRFAELGATANMQPLWAKHDAQMDELTIPFLGERRSGWQYPFGSLSRAGARLASGSDWPVSTANPLEIIHTAVNRSPYRGEGAEAVPFLGEQALSLADALIAHTAGTAYINHDEHRSGTLEIGKAGDIVILDRDIFAHPVAEIAAARVTHTIVGGEVVFTSVARTAAAASHDT
jgi:predicted amidohydrolase YtcJ